MDALMQTSYQHDQGLSIPKRFQNSGTDEAVEAARMRQEADHLGLRYEGVQRGRNKEVALYLVTDPDNMSTFAVKPGETVEMNLRRHREKWGSEISR